MRDNTKFHRSDIPLLIFGTIFYVFSVCIVVPVDAPMLLGSTVSIAMTLYSLFGLPIGLCNLLMNIPIMFFCTKIFGRKMLIYTIIIVFGTSALIDLTVPRFPALFPGQNALNAILCGVVMGVGAGLYLRAGGSMAGTTALTKLICWRFPRLGYGAMLMTLDVSIAAFGSCAQKNLMMFIYSMIYAVICSKVIEAVMLWRNK